MLLEAVVSGLAAVTGLVLFTHESGRLNLVASERAVLLIACPALSSAVWLLHRRLRRPRGRPPGRN